MVISGACETLNVTWTAFCTRLLRPIVTAKAAFVERTGYVVGVSGPHSSAMGLGESVCWPGFGGGTTACAAFIRRQHARSLTWPLEDTVSLEAWHDGGRSRAMAMLDALAAPPEVVCALASALLDLVGQRLQVAVARLLCPAIKDHVVLHRCVDSAVEAQRACLDGFRHVKVKVGRLALDDELAKISAIRAAVGARVGIVLDANGAWPFAVAARALRLYASISPKWVEQPTAPTEPGALAELKRLGLVPIAADESITNKNTLQALMDQDAIDIAVIKPMFVGGPINALFLAHMAERQGIQVCVTHAMEGRLGRLASLHLALAIPSDVPCGLDVVTQDDENSSGPSFMGRGSVPSLPGLGLSASQRAPIERALKTASL